MLGNEMSTLLISSTGVPSRLDALGTARVLAEALDGQAEADLHVTADGFELQCRVVFVRAEGSRLLLRLRGGDTAARAVPASSPLRVTMEVAGARYVFDSRRADCPGQCESGVIQVYRPDAVLLAERRRSPRQRFHGPCDVALYAGDALAESFCEAAMLNLSTEGIACRVAMQQARLLNIGQIVRVVFRLDRSTTEFDLHGRVTNITEGGTAERMVVGLEFVANERLGKDRQRLEEALRE